MHHARGTYFVRPPIVSCSLWSTILDGFPHQLPRTWTPNTNTRRPVLSGPQSLACSHPPSATSFRLPNHQHATAQRAVPKAALTRPSLTGVIRPSAAPPLQPHGCELSLATSLRPGFGSVTDFIIKAATHFVAALPAPYVAFELSDL